MQAPRIVRNKSHPRSAPAASRCSRSFLEGALGPLESGHTAAGAKRPTPGRAARGRPHGTTAEEQHSHVRGLLCACGGGEAALHLRAPAPGRQEERGWEWCSFCASLGANQPAHPKMAPGLEGVRTAARRTMQSLQSVRQRALSTSVPASMSARRSGVTGAAAGIAVLGGGFLAAFKWLQGPASAELAPENVAVVTSQEQLDEVRLCAIVRAQARARNAPRADLPPRPDPHTALQRRHPKCNVCCGRVGRLRFPLALCVCCHNACSLLAPARLLTCPRPRRRSWLHLRDAGAGAQAVWQRCVAKGGAPAAVSVHHQRQCRWIRRAG